MESFSCCLPSRAVIPFFFFIHSYIHCNLLQLFYSGDLPTHIPDDITAMCVLNTKISEAGFWKNPVKSEKDTDPGRLVYLTRCRCGGMSILVKLKKKKSRCVFTQRQSCEVKKTSLICIVLQMGD